MTHVRVSLVTLQSEQCEGAVADGVNVGYDVYRIRRPVAGQGDQFELHEALAA